MSVEPYVIILQATTKNSNTDPIHFILGKKPEFHFLGGEILPGIYFFKDHQQPLVVGYSWDTL